MGRLKPQDVAIALQLSLTPDIPFGRLAAVVGISTGDAHNAVVRLRKARLVRSSSKTLNHNAFIKFLGGGVPYVFAAEPGDDTRGIPTAHSAPPLNREFADEDMVVWPTLDGKVRGARLDPLYGGAPGTAFRNPDLYQLLTLVDALRIGRARERRRAREILEERLKSLDFDRA